PPVMSFTFFAKSRAYSWKMSFAGQVLCQRMLIGPWALTIVGKPSVAAPAVAAAAPARNLRREAVSGFLDCSLLIRSSFGYCKSWKFVPAMLFLFPGMCFAVNGSRDPFVPPAGPWRCSRQSPRILFLTRLEIKLARGLPHCETGAARFGHTPKASQKGE